MAGGVEGGSTPPGERQRLSEALAIAALEPGKAVAVPFDYSLYRLAQKAGTVPWVFEGYPADQPPLLWLVRILEFHRMESSVSVRQHG